MLINIVGPSGILTDLIESFESDHLPRVGESIITKKAGRRIVKQILTDYRDIQPIREEERGSILVFIAVE
ncbi:MAG: hypothetical protein ACOC1K_01270 [Nanoarchaeota archaeon]